MPEEVSTTTTLPNGLKEAASLGLLIPFVGAGASRLAGCPGWSDFADQALTFFVDKGKFSHAQLDQIRGLNPRVKLSLARSLEREHKLLIDFKKILHPTGALSDNNGIRLYSAITQLGKAFVTTNYDEWLDKIVTSPAQNVGPDPGPQTQLAAQSRTILYNVERFTPSCLSTPDTVIHLHGSVLDPNSMIVTTQDYVRHYANDRRMGNSGSENIVLTFLEALFQERRHVLFIGYGLEELEILEYVIGKANLRQEEGKSREIRHYILQGFFTHEKELQRSLNRYYLENGIQLIPYSRDAKNHLQVVDEVERLAALAPASEVPKAEMLREMEDLLNG